MNRKLFFAAVVTMMVGVWTAFAPEPAAAFACEDRICDGNNACRYMANAICFTGTWFPCEWDVCIPE
jgi:hypothetical protein